MPPLRRLSNGRSPLVNQQSQITSFFTKTPSSPSPSPSPTLLKQNPKPNPKSNISPSPTPSPNPRPSPSPSPTTPSPYQTKSRKPLLVISPSTPTTTPSPHQTQSRKPLLVSTPTTPNDAAKSYGEEVLNKRIKVYWPLDNSWYEGFVKSYNKITGKHLVQYDDSEEESLDLTKEKIQWVEEKSKTLRRLRRVSVVIDDNKDEGEDGSGGDDSTDEDWAKNAAKEEEAIDECSEDMDLEDELDEEDGADSPKPKGGKSSASRKRKISDEAKSGSGKKTKSGSNLGNGAIKSISPVPAISAEIESRKLPHVLDNALREDPSERFAMRETEKFHFLGDGRKDANRRCPGDVNYDPKTLYLPPAFLKGLTGGQRQWWEFKSKHMDKVLFFKMGKFYELFEMDAHIGAKELDLQYMKGDQPHCGFPEKNFSMNVEKLARKGYRVLVVEQTETPEQLELRRKEKGIKDKVVKREVCAVITKGTLTEGEMLSANPDASYLMAVTEGREMFLIKTEERDFERIFGVCVVDVATSRVVLGQFQDDYECSALCCLLSELRPVEIIKPAKLLSPETERVLQRHTRSPLVNELVPLLEFWDAEKTVCEVKNVYKHVKDQSVSQSLNENLHTINLNAEKNCSGCLPDVLSELVIAGENGTCALSALGGILFYLKQAFLDETLLRFAKFELLPCSCFRDIPQKPYMVLDAAALENLEIFENSRNGDSSGTLYAQLNHCVTAFGKRLLKTWLARPLCLVDSIRERQDAIACLRGDHLSQVLEFRKELSRLPDMERLLARVFASSESNGRNANKVVLYEDAAKKQLQEFISVLRGCELMAQACSSLGSILENVESILLQHLLTPGKSLPDVHLILKHFKESFDWAEANNSGRIIPHEGADKDYDSASKTVEEIELCLTKHLKEQRKILGDPMINYVTVGKDTYLLEVSESLSGRISSDYELRSSKKGFCRYWTPNIKKLLGELTQAQSEKEFKLKTILQRLIGNFCEHHNKWRQLVSATAELDVLISLAIANDYYEGPTCRPTISSKSSLNEVPNINAKSLGHPVLKSDSLGKGTFVPNDITIGGSGHASFILLSGPNMGGKSTILRQVCLAVILAHVGADVPAESFELSPVDRIFVRMGAKDHIMAGQSTFLTELSETASMLSSATRNSLVALDELGRGTSTSDGQAIAESVLEHFVHKVQCRGMFSTHYHRLAIDFQKDSKVSLCHMGCQVGTGAGGVEEVTFLYRMMPGACPKSYGVNVARLAGLPDKVLLRAAAKSREFEAMYGKKADDELLSQNWEHKMEVCIQKLINVVENLKSDPTSVGSLIELQHGARMLLQQS